MIAKYINGCLTKSALGQLKLDKKEYTWTKTNGDTVKDGLTMLKLVMSTINPSTRVGVGNLMYDIKTTTMTKFDEKVDKMLDFMREMYNKIFDAGKTYPHFLHYLFHALLTSKNAVFKNTI